MYWKRVIHALNMYLWLVQPTAFCLEWRLGPQERIHIWFCKSGQVPWLGRPRALVGKLPLLLLLDLMPVKLFSKYFLFMLPDQSCCQLWSVRLLVKALRITECWKLCPKWDLMSFLPRPRKRYGGVRKDVRGRGRDGVLWNTVLGMAMHTWLLSSSDCQAMTWIRLGHQYSVLEEGMPSKGIISTWGYKCR